MEEIIDTNQTAYVYGRAVADNLCSILFTKDHSLDERLDPVQIPQVAKKAFDSVDYSYIEKTLKKYRPDNFAKIDFFIGTVKSTIASSTTNFLMGGSASWIRGSDHTISLTLAYFSDKSTRVISQSNSIYSWSILVP